MFIVISGAIGVGKSEACKRIAKITGFTPNYETVENHPYLSKFYSAMEKYDEIINRKRIVLFKDSYIIRTDMKYSAFQTQIYFLSDRLRKHFCARATENSISDRSIYEDKIFAKLLYNQGKMTQDDYEKTYLPLFEILTGVLWPPDILFYLTASFETIKARQLHRARPMEKAISDEYNRALQAEYENWYEDYKGQKIRILTEGRTEDEVADDILSYLPEKYRRRKYYWLYKIWQGIKRNVDWM